MRASRSAAGDPPCPAWTVSRPGPQSTTSRRPFATFSRSRPAPALILLWPSPGTRRPDIRPALRGCRRCPGRRRPCRHRGRHRSGPRRPRPEEVAARTADHEVVPAASGQAIRTGAGVEPVVALLPLQLVRARVPLDHVVPRLSLEPVTTRAADQLVVVEASVEAIVPCLPDQAVVPGQGDDAVGGGRAVERLGRRRPRDDVLARRELGPGRGRDRTGEECDDRGEDRSRAAGPKPASQHRGHIRHGAGRARRVCDRARVRPDERLRTDLRRDVRPHDGRHREGRARRAPACAACRGERAACSRSAPARGSTSQHYPARSRRSCSPSPRSRWRGGSRKSWRRRAAPATVVRAPAEALPFADDSFDTVVCTLVLCTVATRCGRSPRSTRVLRPGGRLLFLEHVRCG